MEKITETAKMIQRFDATNQELRNQAIKLVEQRIKDIENNFDSNYPGLLPDEVAANKRRKAQLLRHAKNELKSLKETGI